VSQTSLSLFKDLIDARAVSKPSVVAAEARRSDSRAVQQQHLLAARRLARRMARFADESPEQLRAGRQICRHLVAMLKEAETATRPH
jgi:phosphate uptake regulator